MAGLSWTPDINPLRPQFILRVKVYPYAEIPMLNRNSGVSFRFSHVPSCQMIPVTIWIFGPVKRRQIHSGIFSAKIGKRERHWTALTILCLVKQKNAPPMSLALSASVWLHMNVSAARAEAPPRLPAAHYFSSHIQALNMAVNEGRADLGQLIDNRPAYRARTVRGLKEMAVEKTVYLYDFKERVSLPIPYIALI